MADAMTTASRTSGVAPLAVFFDCINVDGWTSGVVQPELVGDRREYADLEYEWTFDDPTSGTWAKTTGASRNLARGYVASHVFETPGEYTVTLRVTDEAGDAHDYKQTITVTDPDTVFSGNTYYVANAPLGDDGNAGTSEVAPWETFAKAMAEADAGCRILFKRGDSWSISSAGAISGAGPGLVGAWGTGADPIITQTSTSSSFATMAQAAVDWRLMDLDLAGPGVTAGNSGIEGLFDRVLLLNIAIEGFEWQLRRQYDCMPSRPDQLAFIDCDIGCGVKSIAYGAYCGGTRLAFVGTKFTDQNGSHHLRTWHADKMIIASCQFVGVTGGSHAIKAHNSKTVSPPDTRYIYIDDCDMEGGVYTVNIAAQNNESAEYERDCVVENSIFRGTVDTAISVVCCGPYMTIRNNVGIQGTYPATYRAFVISSTALGLTPDKCRAINNTAYGNSAKNLAAVRTIAGSDLKVYNNLACNAGAGTADAWESTGGSGSGDDNLDNYPAEYLADPENDDFTLVEGGTAINTGTTVAYVREDRARTARPQGENYDVGAYEFLTGGDVTPPTIDAISHADGSYITTTSINLDITFSEPIVTPEASAILLTGAAAATAIVGAPADQGGNKWRFSISSLTDGALNVSIAPEPDDIEDLLGNDLVNVDYDYTVDLIAPTVISVSPVDTATVETEDVNVDVNFSEAVTGVDASDLVLTGSASGGAVVETPVDQSGNVWRFPVKGLGNGILNLSLAPDAGDITDLAENDLTEETWSYTVDIPEVDTIPPTVLDRNPAPSATITESSVTVMVTFSEAVQGIDATDMVLTGSAKDGDNTVVGPPTQGATAAIWEFPITNLVTGTLNISLAPEEGDITDLADNSLAPVAWSYTVDLSEVIPPPVYAGCLSPSIEAMRYMLADSAAMASWLEESTQAAALARIYRSALPRPASGHARYSAEELAALFPLAVVWHNEFAKTFSAIGTHYEFGESGSITVRLMQMVAAEYADDHAGLQLAFENELGVILDELADMAGTSPYLSIVGISWDGEVLRTTEAEQQQIGDAIWTEFVVTWEGGD